MSNFAERTPTPKIARQFATLAGGSLSINAACFSPDAEYLATGDENGTLTVRMPNCNIFNRG
jgi:WD40 repeat protein